MPFPTKRAEFLEVEKTRFWGEYSRELDRVREKLMRELVSVDINLGEPMCYGSVLQKNIRLLNQIIELPAKIVGEE
jgi:hypothetical protein